MHCRDHRDHSAGVQQSRSACELFLRGVVVILLPCGQLRASSQVARAEHGSAISVLVDDSLQTELHLSIHEHRIEEESRTSRLFIHILRPQGLAAHQHPVLHHRSRACGTHGDRGL